MLEVHGRARKIARELARLYPDARCSLDFETPTQLLWATILSAQCTDAVVNQVTPALFARYPDAARMAQASQKDVEGLINRVGLFRSKAANLILCSRQMMERHGGEVPRSMEELSQLAGVGRKTANVVLGVAFDLPGLPVDTHVSRLSYRMGLTDRLDPVGIETELCSALPPKEWARFGLRLILHGREVCTARAPRCEDCTLARALCPQRTERPSGRKPRHGKAP